MPSSASWSGRTTPPAGSWTELITSWLGQLVGSAWERGWLPLDLLHVARRGNQRLVPLAATVMTREAAARQADERAPAEWREQLEVIADEAAGLGAEALAGTLVDRLMRLGVLLVDAWADLAALAALLIPLPDLNPIHPVPSAWGLRPRRATPAATTGSGERDRVLNRIRALLAKAEGTEYAAEAEAFTAKAQELISRHAIDEALLHAAEPQVHVVARRVHLANPYAVMKVRLLDSVARANRSKVIYLDSYAIATVVATPTDVTHVEMLFTSLLIQATRAMAEAGAARPGSFDRSVTFRRSFLAAYAHRIGERLAEADRETAQSYGTDLVPVLARQTAAVDATFDRMFPHTVQLSGGYLDGRGWKAGREAADRAVLVSGRLSA